MHKTFLLPLLLLCILLVSCGGGGNIPCPFGPDDLASQTEGVTFEIINQSCTTLCRVFLAAPSCDDWGLDLLLQGDVRVPHGGSYSFQVPPGKYDLSIEDCSEASYNIEKIDLRESSSWTFSLEGMEEGAACEASLTVVNESPVPICHMWIANEYSDRFGNNWLGNYETIPAGGEMTYMLNPDTYDVKAEDCDFNQLRIEFDKEITDHQVWTVP